MLSPEVNQWFIQIKKAESAGEYIDAKYVGQYLGKSRKSNKQSEKKNKSDDEGNDDASTWKDYQKYKKVTFTIGSAMKVKPRKQQLKKVSKLDTRKAFNKSRSDQ